MDKNLQVRIMSALAFIFAVAGIYYFFNITGLMYLSLIAIMLGVNEYGRMFFKEQKTVLYFFNGLCLIFLTAFFTLSLSPFIYLALLCIVIFVLFYYRDNVDTQLQFNTISKLLTGFIYTLVLPFFVLKILSVKDIGLSLFVSMLALTFANDVFAYAFGRLFGKKKILPNISPSKTIAGSFGGLFGTCLFSYLLLHHSLNLTGITMAIVIGLLCSLSGQCGDFFASMIKRTAQVKDSGSIMPGHGGVLDRLDGLYLVAPTFYAIYYLFLV